MPVVVLTDQELVLLERVCEQQGWWATKKTLEAACRVCRKLKDGRCDHKPV